MNLKDLIERFEVIKLPKRELERFRVLTYTLYVLLFLLMTNSSFRSVGIQIIYSNIIYLSIFSVGLCGLIGSTYVLFNYTFFKHPILVLSPRHVYMGTKNLGRDPEIYDTRVIPTDDMQLVIVRDSHSLKYHVFLEKKMLLDLGHFSELEVAEDHRKFLQKRLTRFYPTLYISTPLYQEI
ncbi:MAG: hypothetical protein ACXACP_05725 [Candidatus Hodarchaeales archaeon]